MLTQISTIGTNDNFEVLRRLVPGVLVRRDLFIDPGRIREIFWSANQECQALTRRRAMNIIAKFVPIAVLLFHIDYDKVVQVGSPPCAGFRDVGSAIDIDAELSHDLSTQLARCLRSVDEQHSLLLDAARDGCGER